MFSNFWKIAMLISVLLVAVVLCFGLRSINNSASGKSQSIQLPPAVVSIGRQAIGFANQTLRSLGVAGNTRPTEVVKEKLTEASIAVNEATKNIVP